MNELATMFTTGRGAMARVSMRWHVCSDDRGHFTRTIWGCVDRRIVDTALAPGDECPSDPDRLGIGRRSQGMRQLKERGRGGAGHSAAWCADVSGPTSLGV